MKVDDIRRRAGEAIEGKPYGSMPLLKSREESGKLEKRSGMEILVRIQNGRNCVEAEGTRGNYEKDSWILPLQPLTKNQEGEAQGGKGSGGGGRRTKQDPYNTNTAEKPEPAKLEEE